MRCTAAAAVLQQAGPLAVPFPAVTYTDDFALVSYDLVQPALLPASAEKLSQVLLSCKTSEVSKLTVSSAALRLYATSRNTMSRP